MGFIINAVVGFLLGWHGHAYKQAVIAGLVLAAISGAVWYINVVPWRTEAGLPTPLAFLVVTMALNAVISVALTLGGHWIGRRLWKRQLARSDSE